MVDCPKCHKPMVVRSGRFGTFFGCAGFPNCDIIKNKFGFSDQPTRDARKQAHGVFDKLWKPLSTAPFRRSEAYRLLGEHMGLTRKVCHIEGFSVEQCQAVIEWAKAHGDGEGV